MSEPGDPAIKLFGTTIPMAAAADEEPDVEEAEAKTQQVRREAHLSSFLDPCTSFFLVFPLWILSGSAKGRFFFRLFCRMGDFFSFYIYK